MPRPIPHTILSENGSTFYPESIGLSQPGVLVPHQFGVSAEARHLIILQVRDYPRLSTLEMFEPVTDALVEEMQSGRALLLLDLSNEGPAFRKTIFDRLHQILAARGIPRTSTMLLTQNRELGPSYVRTYGPGAMLFGVHDFFVKMTIGQIAATTALRFETGAEVAAYTPGYDAGARDFLCMNATPRWHRILVYRHLVTTGLADRGLVSFHGANPMNPKASAIDLSSLPAQVAPNFGNLLDGIERWMPKQPVRFDTDARAGNELALSLESSAYRGSLYSIVTDSDFFDDGERVERITEKVVKAACLGHPFILVSNPRSVSFMAELGFETFASVIDHDYDREYDNPSRLRQIFREIARQQALIAADRARWIAATRDAAEYNFRHARNGLLTRYERLVETPLLERLSHFIETGIAR